jgi:hypothetical protein
MDEGAAFIFTQDRLKQIARRKGLSVSQLINEISLRYIGAEEGARMMAERAERGSKEKALRVLEAVRKAGCPPLPEDRLTASEGQDRPFPKRTRKRPE